MSTEKSSAAWEVEEPEEGSLEYYERQIQLSKQRQAESTNRSLTMLTEAEDVGVETGKVLLGQREQLDNAERKLDQIHELSKVNQKHINGLKGMFSNFKSWVTGGGKTDAQASAEPAPSSGLATIVKDREAGASARDADVSGFFDHRNRDNDPYDDYGGARVARSQAPATHREPDEVDAKIDDNLAMMSSIMTRVKGLAIGLGDELEQGNEQLERLQHKASAADSVLQSQNKQMKKIIRK